MEKQDHIQTGIRDGVLSWLFWLGVGALLFTRLVIFFRYNLDVIDSDQPFMWIGASDYAKGLFNEPRYYGQAYNTFMEALFAVPLIWLKIPVYYAVPLATHFIALFPFLFTAFYLYAKRYKIQALLTLAVVLCMPAPYDLLNGMPRGFVTGLFFTSFFVVSLLHPFNYTFLAINTVLAVTGYFVNPNSVIVSMPFLFYIFLHHYKNRRYYIVTLPSLMVALPLHFLFDRFYILHPDYIKNPLEHRISAQHFWQNISNLDQRFTHVSFFFENNSLVLLLVLAALPFCFYRVNRKALAAYGAFIGLLLFSFCVGKTLEGSTWVYMSFSRMYLGIPLYICLFVTVFTIRLKKAARFLFCIPIIFTCFKLANLDRSLGWHHEEKYWVGVHLIKVKSALEAIDFYKKTCETFKAPFFLIASRNWLNTVLDYGAPSVDVDFPETQETSLEKRYWVRQKNNNRVVTKFILLTSCFELGKNLQDRKDFELHQLDNYGLFLVDKNTLPMGKFIDLVKKYE